MPSIQAILLRSIVRRIRPSLKKDIPSIRRLVSNYEHRVPGVLGVHITPELSAPAPAEWTVPNAGSPTGVLLYFHGGGFVVCSPRTHRTLVAAICRQANVRALSVDYRLAPEHPFPAALEDTLAVYHWLLDGGIPPHQIVLGGDSAGGNLVLGTLLSLRDAQAPLPAAAFCLSPVTDLTGKVPSRVALMDADPLLPSEAGQWIEAYVAGTSPEHPLLSPLFADLRGFPPLLLQVGTLEILLDDSRLLAEKAEQVGVEVELEIYPGMWHVFQAFSSHLPETKQAIRTITRFIQKHLEKPEQ